MTYQGLTKAIHDVCPINLLVRDNVKDDTYHVICDLRGDVFYHQVYTHNLMMTMPDGLIQFEAREASSIAWRNFINGIDWTTYWEDT